jgi:plastocyanin
MSSRMMRSLTWPMLIAVASAALGTPAIVEVGGPANAFLPRTITIDVGETLVFINKGGLHNVLADDASFRCAIGCDGDGQGGNGAASNTIWIASVTFTKPRTVGYFCEIHGAPSQGMFGTIIVKATTIDPIFADGFESSRRALERSDSIRP